MTATDDRAAAAAAVERLSRLVARGAELQDRVREMDAELRAMLPAPDEDLVAAQVDDEGRLVALTIAPDATSRCSVQQLKDAINVAIAYRTGPVRSILGADPRAAAALVAAVASGGRPTSVTYPYGDGSVGVDAVLGRIGRVHLSAAFVRRSDAATIARTVVEACAAARAASSAESERR